MIGSVCFCCDKLIEDGNYTLLPLEVPYANLFFHKECIVPYKDDAAMLEYIKTNYDRIYHYHCGVASASKKKKLAKFEPLTENDE